MKCAGVLLICLTLGSGCAAGQYIALGTTLCPRPAMPTMPELDGSEPFDSPQNVEVLLSRHRETKQYMRALNSTLDCFEAQVKQETDYGSNF